jgi:cytochrome c biogenesis protein CcmG/thiol:disulfide interchange protein DsbE
MRTPLLAAVLVSILIAAAVAAQTPVAQPPAVTTPAVAPALASATPTPAPQSRTVQSVRNKLSAADLPSAESLLEVHHERFGEDAYYLDALGWVARGALMLQDYDAAQHYATELRRLCAERLATEPHTVVADSLATPLGAAIEVEAQLRARSKGKADATRFLDGELKQIAGPVSLISRVNKRRNMLTLAGTMAPELVVEDFVGDPPPTLASLRGKPVLIFVWAYGCGDCRAQCASLAKIKAKYEPTGLRLIALTRYFEDDHVREKTVVDSVWADPYKAMGKAPIIISTASMERYGGSSTPTFVFIDRKGVVQWYTPTRLTEAALDRAVAAIMK